MKVCNLIVNKVRQVRCLLEACTKRLAQNGDRLRINCLESRPIECADCIVGGQCLTSKDRQGLERVLSDAAGKKLTVAVLHLASQLALHRFLVESNQNRLTADLFERCNVLLLLERQL